jgi:hypothetical protein
MLLDSGPDSPDDRCMFIRATSTLSALLIMAALAAAAFATDSPPPDLSPAPSDSAIQQTLNKCSDTTKPHSAISAKAAKAASHSRTLRGTARDTPCGVAMVTIAIDQQHGKKCRFLTKTGRLGKAGKCTRSSWLTAVGTKTWRVPLSKLRKGTYKVRIRAVDLSGNIEKSHGRKLKLG